MKPSTANALLANAKLAAMDKAMRTELAQFDVYGKPPIVGVSVRIPGMKLVSGMNAREHHMAKARRAKQEKQTVGMTLLTVTPIRPPCVVTLTRIYAGNAKAMDEGCGLNASFKAVRDAVAAWLGTDDGPRGGLTFRYSQERGTENAVVISVSPPADAKGQEQP